MQKVKESSRTRSLGAKLAGAASRGASPEVLTEHGRNYRAAQFEDWAHSVARSAPPLTRSQRIRIAEIVLAGDIEAETVLDDEDVEQAAS